MGLGASLFLITVGAILRFAVTATTQGFNVQAAGVILMVIGALGLVLSFIFWSSWGGFHRRVYQAPQVIETRPSTVVHHVETPPTTAVVEERRRVYRD